MVETSTVAGERTGGEEPKSVLAKVFLILECFLSGTGSLTLADLSRSSGLPKSTVHRLTTSLVEWGALERVDGNFRLGLRMFELGGRVPRWHQLRDAALPFMEDLFEATHETVHLGLLDDRYVVYLEKIRGHRSVRTESRIGGRLPAHCTAIGKALLAFSPRDVQAEILRARLVARTRYTITQPAVLVQQFAEIVESGVAYDREEAALGLQCAAAPVFNASRHPVAALSVSVPTGCFDAERFAPAVRTAALGLSRTLHRSRLG